ncbi:MAG: hypothetical protein M3O30_17550 [Planctomycetota bacterium]|nr:hypothetical protein [Planctomycetota bacterium]
MKKKIVQPPRREVRQGRKDASEESEADRLLKRLEPWEIVDLLEAVMRNGINQTLLMHWKKRGIPMIEVPAIRNLMRLEYLRREAVNAKS